MVFSEAEYGRKALGRGFVGLKSPGEEIGVLLAVLEGTLLRMEVLSERRGGWVGCWGSIAVEGRS